MHNRKIILVVVVLLIGIAIGGYVFVFKNNEESDTLSPLPPLGEVKEMLGIQPSTKNWQTYTIIGGGFSIKYPEGYTVKEQTDSSDPLGQVVQAIFLPPGPEDKPELWKGLPITVLIVPEIGYAEMKRAFEKEKDGGGYYKETPKTVAGIKGIEIRVGLKNLKNIPYAIYAMIPYKKDYIVFNTFAKDKNQLEQDAVPLFEAFISTFKPN